MGSADVCSQLGDDIRAEILSGVGQSDDRRSVTETHARGGTSVSGHFDYRENRNEDIYLPRDHQERGNHSRVDPEIGAHAVKSITRLSMQHHAGHREQSEERRDITISTTVRGPTRGGRS